MQHKALAVLLGAVVRGHQLRAGPYWCSPEGGPRQEARGQAEAGSPRAGRGTEAEVGQRQRARGRAEAGSPKTGWSQGPEDWPRRGCGLRGLAHLAIGRCAGPQLAAQSLGRKWGSVGRPRQGAIGRAEPAEAGSQVRGMTDVCHGRLACTARTWQVQGCSMAWRAGARRAEGGCVAHMSGALVGARGPAGVSRGGVLWRWHAVGFEACREHPSAACQTWSESARRWDGPYCGRWFVDSDRSIVESGGGQDDAIRRGRGGRKSRDLW